MSKTEIVFVCLLGIFAAVITGYILKARNGHPQINPSVQKSASKLTMQPSTIGQTEITNWKTYSNTKEGFSIQYPSDASFSLDTNVTNGVLVWLIFPSIPPNGNFNGYRVYIASVPNTN